MALIQAFRCDHSGLYYPADYVKQWGRKYGLGLGPTPCSEVLDSQDTMAIAVCDRDMSKTMQPVGNTFARVSMVDVEESVYEENRAILAIDDPYMEKRSKIIQAKQKVKNQKLKALLDHLI